MTKRIVLLLVLSLTFAHAQSRTRRMIPDDAGPRDLVEAQAFIERQPTSSIAPNVARTQRVVVVAAATSTPLCTVRTVVDGPLPGGNVELLLQTGGIVYRSPVSNPKTKKVPAVFMKVPCNFNQKTAKVGRSSTYELTFNVEKCRCGKLTNGQCRKVTAGCK